MIIKNIGLCTVTNHTIQIMYALISALRYSRYWLVCITLIDSFAYFQFLSITVFSHFICFIALSVFNIIVINDCGGSENEQPTSNHNYGN
jgi:hypothetical protein